MNNEPITTKAISLLIGIFLVFFRIFWACKFLCFLKMKKDPTNVDPDALYYLENNWFKKINAIAQKAFKIENYEILSELECD